jgi:DMSO/TMAO reductase YedYZ molybdopterin-dependent catalytic subunit
MQSSSSPLLRVVQVEPFNAETPMGALAEPVTPLDSFFVRSSFAVPCIDADTWRLSVGGLVQRPVTIGLGELQALGTTDMEAVMECAGNGRRLMSPVPAGTPWELGAVSTGRFTGVPLMRLLETCGVDPRAVELVFAGADSGELPDGRVAHFERSLPVERAMDPSTLLVWAMNGEPLTPGHGYPVRLFVPGYYGVASVKWLERITAADTPFSGHFQTDRYIYRAHPTHPDNTPVTRIHVRSVIALPEAGQIVTGTVIVRGTAWSGYGTVRRVQISGDGGATWLDATLRTPASPRGPTIWSCEWTPPGTGEFELVARAEDSSGEVQPLDPVWNALGYANNVAHRVRVRGEPAA